MRVPSPIRSAAFILSLTLSVSCGSPTPQTVLTVEELVPHIDELDGRLVTVTGYLPECLGYTCTLYRTKHDFDVRMRALAALEMDRSSKLPDFPTLGIGSGENVDFDAKAAAFTNSYVVITGTITNDCRFEGKPACTDRSTDLEPKTIRAGNPPAHRVSQ